jgi:hypothetical protein
MQQRRKRGRKESQKNGPERTLFRLVDSLRSKRALSAPSAATSLRDVPTHNTLHLAI